MTFPCSGKKNERPPAAGRRDGDDVDRWTEMELFVQVAETGSLSRAAEALDLSNAAASRHLAALEARLGARLVERNTRRLFLTDVGDAFYHRCKPLLAEQWNRRVTPPGMKLVPIEPTREMLDAANRDLRREYATLGLGDGSHLDATKAARNYYAAMLAAAPDLPPNAPGQGSAACGASPAPTGCASNDGSER